MAPPRRGPSSSSASKRQQQHTQSTQSGIHRFFSAHNAHIAPSTPAAEPPTQSVTLTQGNISKPLVRGESQQERKLQRISPGMLIQPSQDDGGGDQVVWKFSPITDRLQEASAADTGQHPPPLHNKEKPCSLPNIQQLFQKSPTTEINGPMQTRKKRSPNLAGKLEQWLSASNKRQENGGGTAKATSKHDTLCLEQPLDWHQQTPAAWDKENIMANNLSSGPGPDVNSQKSSQGQGHSARRLLRRHSLVGKVQKRKNGKQRGSGQRRKALLELLDQVQNVMSDPESVSSHTEGDAAGLEKNFKSLKSFATYKQKTSIKDFSGAETKNIDTASKQNSECFVTPKEIVTPISVKGGLFTRELTHCAPSLLKATSKDAVNCNNDVDALFLQLDQTDSFSAIPEALASIHFLVLEVADVVDRDGQKTSPKKVLRLLNEYSGLEQILYLVDEWYFTVVRPGDTINVIGEFDSNGKCTIDRSKNLLIVHPDILISGSKIGTSFSCPRRAVLDERIRSSSVAFPALLGTMMHELFQVGLRDRVTSRLFLEQEAEVIVHRYIDSLFACGGNEKDALIKLRDSIPTILNWLDCFLYSTSSAFPKVDFGMKDGQLSVSVTEVTDIEEMIYSPKFGLKGMIDASLLVKLESLTLASKEQILPLEFKSGKQTSGQAALEHRAQVILYSLLMSDRYRESVDSGLLYYLQTNQTQGVTTQRGDLLGLVMRRNEHATNMLSASSTQQLPPMLQSMHLCQRCWHMDICSIYHKALEGGTADSSGLGEVFNQKTDHLSGSYIEFLKSWDRLIDLEAQELQASQREIWRLPALERERSGRCLPLMKLNHQMEGSVKDKKNVGAFLYSFSRNLSYITSSRLKRQMSEAIGLHECSFSCGDHVLLSTESGHVAVAAGSVCDIKEDKILVQLSQKLRLPQQKGVSDKEVLFNQVWRIDKDETASFLATMRFNILQLFLKNGHEQGRRLIIDLEPPKFDNGGLFSQDPAATYVRSASTLNDDQRRAIFKILSARDYALILGMPGTGKTSTIVHAVKALLARGASILLTSYTNSAVDNILLKLKQEGVDFVRLGRENAIHPELKSYMTDDLSTVQDLEIRMSTVHVVAATCLGVTHPLLTDRKFDVCIVDEAGQITLPVCVGPLRFANTFVLVGDHYQLPPLVRNAEARERGLAVSLFRRLSEAHPQSIAALQCQYRMSSAIMRLCNTLIYGDRLRCGSPAVANGRLIFQETDVLSAPSWLQKVLDAANSAVFVNTDMLSAVEIPPRSSTCNMTEAQIVILIFKHLRQLGVEAKDIGIISPYNYQVQHIRRLLAQDEHNAVEVHTVDRFQGRDKDCVLVSFVKSSTQARSSSSLLADWHRINVAITRAKKKLILIGSRKTLSSTPVLKLLISQVEQIGGLVDIPKDASTVVAAYQDVNIFKK